jgi:acyl-CoA synthetase (NDP forming)
MDSVKIEADTYAIPMDQALQLCKKADIPTPPWKVVETAHEAALAAKEIGFPVALKILSTEISHKTDVGGVILNLKDATSLRKEAESLLMRFHELTNLEKPPSILVQKMLPIGIELILGGKRDPTFGPVVMFGLGGIHVEVFDDVAFRVAPINQQDAHQMISEVRGSSLLKGSRGSEPVDQEEITQALLSISNLMLKDEQIVELDINPLIASADGVMAVDVRVLRSV